MPLMAYAKDPIEIDGIYYIIENSATVTKNPNKYSGDIVIPESVSYEGNNYLVGRIDYDAFMDCSGLTSIKLPEGLLYIEASAFSGCSKLSNIELPNSILYIGNNAFYDCRSLKSINIPKNEFYSSVGHEFNCSGLTSIDIPNTITRIDGFYGCTELTSVFIPKTVTEIVEYSFGGCYSLEKITVESANQVYDSRDNCNAIVETKSNKIVVGCKNTNYPNNVNTIGEGAFIECIGLMELNIPDNIHTIEKNAFSRCQGLTKLEIPESITSLGIGAFNDCENIISVSLPKSIEDISSVFTNCINLKSIDIPENITNINDAFTGCSSLSSVTFTGNVKNMYMAFFSCIGLKSIIIPEGVTIINGEAFSYSGLEEVVIPSTIHAIERNSFSKCKELKDFYSYAELVPILDETSFYNTNIGKAILHVPSSSINQYKSAPIWKDFGSIIAIEDKDPKTTAINTISSENRRCNIYDLRGKRVDNISSGIYIINGKKRYVKK